MKKYLLIVALVCFGLNAGAQIIVRPQAYCSGLSDLDEAHKLGNFVFGDSITKYLWDLKLIETDKKGYIKAAVKDYELGFFRLGGHAPFLVHLDSRDYLISSLYCFFDDMDEKRAKEYLEEVYGKPTTTDNNEPGWFGQRFYILTQRIEGVFCVSFHYINK